MSNDPPKQQRKRSDTEIMRRGTAVPLRLALLLVLLALALVVWLLGPADLSVLSGQQSPPNDP